MDHISPARVMEEVEAASTKKAALSTRALLLMGFFSGALLAYATFLAVKAAEGFTTGAAALISGAAFSVGFAMIVLLGPELATGNFTVLTIGTVRGKTTWAEMLRNWGWMYLGNFLGCVFLDFLLLLTFTESCPPLPSQQSAAKHEPPWKLLGYSARSPSPSSAA